MPISYSFCRSTLLRLVNHYQRKLLHTTIAANTTIVEVALDYSKEQPVVYADDTDILLSCDATLAIYQFVTTSIFKKLKNSQRLRKIADIYKDG